MLDAGKMASRAAEIVAVRDEGSVVILATRRYQRDTLIQGEIRLEALREDMVRVRFAEEIDGTIPDKIPSLSMQAVGLRGKWVVSESAEHWDLSTGSLSLQARKAGAGLSWFGPSGELLVREPTEGGKWLQPVDVSRLEYNTDSAAEEIATVDGVKSSLSEGREVFVRKAFSARLALEFAEDEAIYGLGQHEEGILNYRGHSQYLYQQNMKVAIPVLVSSKGYGIYFDTHALSTFEDGPDGGAFWTDVVDELDFTFIYGPSLDTVVDGLRELTGQMPMLPRWAYGFVQSKERYETAKELVAVAREYRERNLPLDCIVLDWDSWIAGLWGQKTLDPERFPEPEKMMRDLHKLGVRLMISIWPTMRADGPNHLEFQKLGKLFADGATYDALDEDARRLYWKHANEGLFSKGIDAWWCDCTEPCAADWQGSTKLEAWQRMVANVGEFKKVMDPALINAYSLEHAKGIYEGQRSVTDEKRVVNLTRSGSLGQQRYGTVVWSGDIEARWSRMRKQIADGLNFVVTGNPRWTLDIGGFFVKPGEEWFWDGVYPKGYEDSGFAELYVRWFQMGVFLPMFRSHGTDTPREIWRFGEEGTRFYDILKQYDELRYQLLPYIYSVAAWEVFRGYTMLRMLAFDFREDQTALTIDDQYMFGPALLVCPVTAPMYYEAGGKELTDRPKTRRVYLPQGSGWTDFWTNEHFDGGQWIEAEAPLEKMPLYVRDGSIIPMGPVIQHADADTGEPWEVRIYPGRDATFSVYEDSGDGYAYEQGAYAWRELTWDDTNEAFKSAAPLGSFDGMVAERSFTEQIMKP